LFFFAELLIPKATLRAAPHGQEPQPLARLQAEGTQPAPRQELAPLPQVPAGFLRGWMRTAPGEAATVSLGRRQGTAFELAGGCWSRSQRALGFQRDPGCSPRVPRVYQSAFYTGEKKGGLFSRPLLAQTRQPAREILLLMS